MSQLQITRATRQQVKARIALDGPSGGGKTYTALIAAKVLAAGGKIILIDTERKSASLYADDPDLGVEFDKIELDDFDPAKYVQAIQLAEKSGYAVCVIDSLSHAWEGKGGILDLHDKAVERQKTKNSWTAWADVTPIHRDLVDAMLQSNMHIIATMRSKMEYVQEKNESTGRTEIKKLGMAPIQRQGMEYEFTVVADLDIEHTLTVSKSRCKLIADAVVKKPDESFFEIFANWLNSGAAFEPTRDLRTIWTEFIKTNAVTDTHVRQALGMLKVSEWLAAESEKPRTIEGAMELVRDAMKPA